MPPRLPDDKRAAILADIRTGRLGAREIARQYGVASSTVTKIAKDEGVEGAFERSQTINATRAVVIDAKAARVAIARRLLAKADELLDQMDQPHVVFNIGGKDNIYTEHLMNRPPTADLRNLMVTAATALDKHLALDRHDSGSSTAANSLLGAVAQSLQAAYDHGVHTDGNVTPDA